ncbi:methyl-accepting chemotaxis sensory transducer with GAF sensor [Malonomonas rubra DSM 5091]|uniref:Methyl-accepting chemotaxis sensory transducer with GAF sensor n=1 Tax=Malonomonas rubra DSM 5091 TaxID=1122189 RepID=A0A1M6B539_MALRU|nr:methyl-accepting chemotaxis protein [Malonomonas rubra]SHI43777.1 methyl-accepting chemotaxis sensory transducer with GAF sensor [Malonomonas rubra DSM 5091]
MNIFSLIIEKSGAGVSGKPGNFDRSVIYAVGGLLLGISAPIGWMLVRTILFYNEHLSIWSQTIGNILINRQQLALFVYMGGGTAVVLGTFGYFIGRAAEQIHSRAARLNEMNLAVESQKEEFERKYRELNNRITDFHSISARIQKTMDIKELLSLTGDGLHEVIDFDRVNILQVKHDTDEMELVVSLGDNAASNVSAILPLDDRAGVLYKAVTEQRDYLVDDIDLMPNDFRLRPPCDGLNALRSNSFLVCPVIVNGLVELVLAVDNKSSGRKVVEDDADTLKLFAAQLSASIIRLRLFSAVDSLTQELERTFTQFMKYRQDYQLLLKTLKRASASTIRLVADIANSADVVRDAVNSTQSASTQISVSIDEVGTNINQLSEFMDKSISAMTEIAATIKEVDDNSVSSHKMSEQVLEHAEGGVDSVQETLAGLDGIAKGVATAAETIYHLSIHGEEISTITSVITEIAQKTNLLALNAAIIAAQAGEQGRSFAVVAEEIRSLSQKTANSSGAIAQLIRDMHAKTTEVVSQITNVEALVTQGGVLGGKTEKSLSQILASATSAKDMSQNIRHATREVSRSAEFVTHSIEELGEMTEQVSTASREQAQGTHGIVRSIEDIRDMADEMANVAIQQRQDSRDIETAVESVADMAERIFDEMDARSEQSRMVINQLRQFKETE